MACGTWPYPPATSLVAPAYASLCPLLCLGGDGIIIIIILILMLAHWIETIPPLVAKEATHPRGA